MNKPDNSDGSRGQLTAGTDKSEKLSVYTIFDIQRIYNF
jgi:hypothetical protein